MYLKPKIKKLTINLQIKDIDTSKIKKNMNLGTCIKDMNIREIIVVSIFTTYNNDLVLPR